MAVPAISSRAAPSVTPMVPPPLPAAAAPPPVRPPVGAGVAPPPEPEPGPLATSVRHFEAAALGVLRKVWNWLIVGEEFRDPRRSLEYAVATTWGIRLAIALFVTGIAFGLRMSFERGWIGPDGRLTLGTLAGVAMVAAGLRLLGRRYHLIGQGLIGGGLATLYVTIYAGHHLYGRIPTVWIAFGLMALVTAAAGVIAVSTASLLIAVLGLVGGYATPFVLAGSGAGYEAFFGYLLVLGLGILLVGHFRYWVLLNYLGMAFTYIHVLRTLHQHYQPAHFHRVMPFLAAIFVLYALVTLIYNVGRRRPSTLIEALGLLLNSGLFFGIAQHLIRQAYDRQHVAILTVALATFYILLIYAFLQRRLEDRPLLLSLLALAGFYVAVTMPLLLSREWLTVSWAVQAFIMLWLSRRLGSRFLQALACVLYGIVTVRVFSLDLYRAFPRHRGELPWTRYALDLLERLIAFGVPIAALVGAWRLHAGPAPSAAEAIVSRKADSAPVVKDRVGLVVFAILAAVLVFVYLHLELNQCLAVVWDPLRLPALTCLWLILVAALWWLPGRPAASPWLVVLGWTALAFTVLKVLAVDLSTWDFRLAHMCFGTGYSWVAAAMRLLDFGAVIGFGLWAARALVRRERSGAPVLLVLALTLLFLYLTAEVNTAVRHYEPGLRSGGISVLWSAYALGLVMVGIRRALRPARLAGLVLFAIVGLKVFFVDLSHLAAFYRMLALLVMGGIILLGTFVYLRNAERFEPAKTKEPTP